VDFLYKLAQKLSVLFSWYVYEPQTYPTLLLIEHNFVIQVVYSAISLPFSIYELVETGEAITIANLVFVIMMLLCTPLLAYVAFTGRKENLLLPWLILQMVYVISKIFLLVRFLFTKFILKLCL